MDGCILRMCGINKSFFGVPVLKNAQLEVLPGEVHVLLGENGAGKSTLIKILSGAYGREGGDIQLDGRELAPMTPKEALDAGTRNLILYRICLYMKIYSLERNTARGFLWTISVP